MTSMLSAGIDIGTTTTQLVFSRLTLENRASCYSVPDIAITEKEIVYRSPVWRTPLVDERTIDAPAVARLIREGYRLAGVEPEQVETGAVIITGETARKDNADQVLHQLSELAGEFVVATAGPSLEGILAGRGAGCDRLSETGPVLNLDMGGGTTNLALFSSGQVVSTGCLNVGGRLLAYDEGHRLSYRSPVLNGFCSLQIGQEVAEPQLRQVAKMLTEVLEEALGLRPKDRLAHFITDQPIELTEPVPRLCFSGGVAACMEERRPWDAYGDLGVLLAEEIMASPIYRLPRVQGRETLRATVVGAGSHSTQLSGSTIFYTGMAFPLKNLPVVRITPEQEEGSASDLASEICRRQAVYPQEQTVLSLSGRSCRHFADLQRLASAISAVPWVGGMVVAAEADIAKALGQALHRLRPEAAILCIDAVRLLEGMYLDVGSPVAGGQALPVVVKTLILS